MMDVHAVAVNRLQKIASFIGNGRHFVCVEVNVWWVDGGDAFFFFNTFNPPSDHGQAKLLWEFRGSLAAAIRRTDTFRFLLTWHLNGPLSEKVTGEWIDFTPSHRMTVSIVSRFHVFGDSRIPVSPTYTQVLILLGQLIQCDVVGDR